MGCIHQNRTENIDYSSSVYSSNKLTKYEGVSNTLNADTANSYSRFRARLSAARVAALRGSSDHSFLQRKDQKLKRFGSRINEILNIANYKYL